MTIDRREFGVFASALLAAMGLPDPEPDYIYQLRKTGRLVGKTIYLTKPLEVGRHAEIRDCTFILAKGVSPALVVKGSGTHVSDSEFIFKDGPWG